MVKQLVTWIWENVFTLPVLGLSLGCISLFLQRRRRMPKLAFGPYTQGIAGQQANNLWWLHVPVSFPKQLKLTAWMFKTRVEYCEAKLYFEGTESARQPLELRWQSENPMGDKYATIFYNREPRAIPLIARCVNQREVLIRNLISLEPTDVFITDFQLMFRSNKTVAARLNNGSIYTIRLEITAPDFPSWRPQQRYRLTVPEDKTKNDGMTLGPI